VFKLASKMQSKPLLGILRYSKLKNILRSRLFPPIKRR
jgi:hypothetical protein